MPDWTLLIDMGNTRLKWVFARGGALVESSFGHCKTADFEGQFHANAKRQADCILISSVAGSEETTRIAEICGEKFGVKAQRLQSQSSLAGLSNGYDKPATLGVDRWLAIVGAALEYGMPIVIMDIGTATTLDAVDAQGAHTGGLIFPGPGLMLRSLADATAMQVPSAVGNEIPESVKSGSPGVGPATSTDVAIVEGVYAAQVGALNQFLRHVSAGQKAEPRLVLTGGAAKGILKRLEYEPVHDPWLVFRGMLHNRK